MIEFKELSKTYYNYALNFLEENYLTQSIEYLKRSIMLDKKNIEALNLIGICEYRNCNFEKAYYFWSKSYEHAKENNRANKYLKELKSAEFKEFIIFYNRGIENFELGKYKESIEIFEEIIRKNHELIEPYILTAMSYYNIKNYDIAKELLEKVILLDKSNEKYFNILKEIDYKNINIYKNWIIKRKKIIGVLGAVASLSILNNTFNYKNILKQEDMIVNYEKNISKIEETLIDTVNEKNILNTQLEGYKFIDNKINLNNSTNKNSNLDEKYKNEDEGEIFLRAINFFKKEEYKKALDDFLYISEKGEQTTLVGESTFFSAVCAEKVSNNFLAEKYYEKYITNFKNCNYYDDSLYNYGLTKYKLGDIEKAKKILNKLKNEVPNSIFLNSKVKYILK